MERRTKPINRGGYFALASASRLRSGARWNEALAERLEDTDFGIICLTRENQMAPWLSLEAGALARNKKSAKMIPLCVDLAPAEMTGPLEAFQSRALSKDGVRQIVVELNGVSGRALPGSTDFLVRAVRDSGLQDVTTRGPGARILPPGSFLASARRQVLVSAISAASMFNFWDNLLNSILGRGGSRGRSRLSLVS